MATFKFRSMKSDQYAYAFDSGALSSYGTRGICGDLVMFDTLGDGMIAHSPDHMIGPGQFEDYCYSLVDYIMAVERERGFDEAFKLTGTISYPFSAPESEKAIEFALSVKFKEKAKKDSYYSVEERKVTTAESKRHDRRYELVEKWMDGSAESAARILWKDYHESIKVFILRHQIRDYVIEHDAGWLDMPTFEKDADYQQRAAWMHAYNAVSCLIRGMVAVDAARRGVDNHRRTIEKAAKEVA
jgi:hypothetical protein